jgi:hypothetical protein
MDTCRPLLDSAGFGGGGRAAIGENVEIQDAFVEFTECVRDGGYDVGDLTFGAPAGQPPADGEGDGEGRGQGQRQQGFGDRSGRWAQQLGLDYEDPAVAEVIDGCIPIIDEAFTNAGVGGRP